MSSPDEPFSRKRKCSGTESAQKLALATGARAAATNTEAVAGAEVVILAVGYPVVQSLAATVTEMAEGEVAQLYAGYGLQP